MDPAIELTLRMGLAALLAAAGAHKLRDPRRFRAVLADYRVLPPGLVSASAVLVPGVEIAAAALLLTSPFRAAGAAAAALLLVVYSAGIALNLLRGRRHIDCGCTGWGAQRTIGWGLVGRNGLLTAAALATLLPSSGRPLVWVDFLTAIAATAVLAASSAAIDQMLGLAPALARLRGES